MSEYNLCSVLIHVQQDKVNSVNQQLQLQAGVEVHAKSADGRIIVTVEDECRKTVAERIMNFYDISDVLSASVIYQFSDDDFDENEIIELKTR